MNYFAYFKVYASYHIYILKKSNYKYIHNMVSNMPSQIKKNSKFRENEKGKLVSNCLIIII